LNITSTLKLIREAGKIPAQRNTKYETLRMFEDESEVITNDFVMQN
jgi:cyclic dehypoxanthinyl futalosine synthase